MERERESTIQREGQGRREGDKCDLRSRPNTGARLLPHTNFENEEKNIFRTTGLISS